MMMNEAKRITDEYLGMVIKHRVPDARDKGIHPNFWKTYETEKSKRLFKLFNENLIIEKKIQFEKNIEQIVETIHDNALIERIHDSLDQRYKDILARNFHWDYSTFSTTDRNGYDIKSFIYQELLHAYSLARQSINRGSFTFTSPVTGKSIKIHHGAKISRMLKHFITDKSKLEEVQNLYSQILNDKLIEGTLCLSIHPLDYLTVSVNNSGWTSCFDTLEGGCWCASTLSLFSSPNTFVAYLKRDADATYTASYYSNESIVWNDKRWRSFITLSEDGELIHIGRNYPYQSDEIMDEVRKMVAELSGFDYQPVSSTNDYVTIETPNNMYNDAEGRGSIFISCTKEYAERMKENDYEVLEEIQISPVGAICPICGDSYDDGEFEIVCGSCAGTSKCAECGCFLSEDESNYIEDLGVCLCDECAENTHICSECGCLFSDENLVKEVIVVIRGGNRLYQSMCTSCIERRGDIITCSECGRLVTSELSETGSGMCVDCFHSKEREKG